MNNTSIKKVEGDQPLIRLLLVDDHDVVRSGVKLMLSRYKDIKIVGEASSGLRAVEMVRDCDPDIILMDIKMPDDIGGLGATLRILSSNPHIKVIILSAIEEEPFPSQCLDAGAKGYLSKRCSAQELAKAIRDVYKGNQYFASHIKPVLTSKKGRTTVGEPATPFNKLSTREMVVAQMISNGQSILAVAKKLCISRKTVNTYRYRAFEKLGIKNDIELTHLAIKHNIVDNEALYIKS